MDYVIKHLKKKREKLIKKSKERSDVMHYAKVREIDNVLNHILNYCFKCDFRGKERYTDEVGSRDYRTCRACNGTKLRTQP